MVVEGGKIDLDTRYRVKRKDTDRMSKPLATQCDREASGVGCMVVYSLANHPEDSYCEFGRNKSGGKFLNLDMLQICF